MDQPQPCTKCKKLPEDILMLACSHDLCLDCASERLAFEMKKKKPANVNLNTYRALSVKSATKEQLWILRASPNSKNSYPLPKQLQQKHMPSQGSLMIGLSELIDQVLVLKLPTIRLKRSHMRGNQ